MTFVFILIFPCVYSVSAVVSDIFLYYDTQTNKCTTMITMVTNLQPQVATTVRISQKNRNLVHTSVRSWVYSPYSGQSAQCSRKHRPWHDADVRKPNSIPSSSQKASKPVEMNTNTTTKTKQKAFLQSQINRLQLMIWSTILSFIVILKSTFCFLDVCLFRIGVGCDLHWQAICKFCSIEVTLSELQYFCGIHASGPKG